MWRVVDLKWVGGGWQVFGGEGKGKGWNLYVYRYDQLILYSFEMEALYSCSSVLRALIVCE